MITFEDADIAVHSILNHAPEIAKSKAEKEYLEQFLKSKKALIVQEATGTILERESYAYAHPDYIQLLKDIRAANEEYERRRWLMVGWQTKIDAWRTQESSRRINV